MNSTNVIESLAKSVVLSIETYLPEVKYNSRSRMLQLKEGKEPEWRFRRPFEHEITVKHFQQMWGSTALGFKGVGGSAMTNAYTTVVILDKMSSGAVFFEGRFAYLINYADDSVREKFFQALNDCNMPCQSRVNEQFKK